MAEPAQRAPRRAVLVVDDDADIRTIISQILELEGYQTFVAQNGADALAQLQAQVGCLGVVLLDLMMPVMNGWQFRAEQEKDPVLAAVPVVIISGDGHVDEKKSQIRAADYLVKPVDFEVLLAMVQKYCG